MTPSYRNQQDNHNCRHIVGNKDIQDWVALMSKPIALFKKKLISLVRLKVISFLG